MILLRTKEMFPTFFSNCISHYKVLTSIGLLSCGLPVVRRWKKHFPLKRNEKKKYKLAIENSSKIQTLNAQTLRKRSRAAAVCLLVRNWVWATSGRKYFFSLQTMEFLLKAPRCLPGGWGPCSSLGSCKACAVLSGSDKQSSLWKYYSSNNLHFIFQKRFNNFNYYLDN